MTNFFQKLSREKLYKQWVKKEGLSPEDLPTDLKKDERNTIKRNNDSANQPVYGERHQPKVGKQTDSILNSIGIRFILIMALIIIVLLVAFSVLLTVFIMRGC